MCGLELGLEANSRIASSPGAKPRKMITPAGRLAQTNRLTLSPARHTADFQAGAENPHGPTTLA